MIKWVGAPSFTYDIRRRIPDASKAKEILGFEAEVKLDDGLREVVAWLMAELKPEAITGSSDNR